MMAMGPVVAKGPAVQEGEAREMAQHLEHSSIDCLVQGSV